MQRSLSSLALFLIAHFLIAQQSTTIKVYWNTKVLAESNYLLGISSLERAQRSEREWDFGWLSLALNRTTANGHEHELELLRLSFSNKEYETYREDVINSFLSFSQGAWDRRLTIAARYQYRIPLLQSDNDSWIWGAAFGTRAQLRAQQIVPTSSFDSPLSLLQFDGGLEFTPYVQYRLSERLAVEAGFPLNLLSLTWTQTLWEEPRFTFDQPRQSTTQLQSVEGRFAGR